MTTEQTLELLRNYESRNVTYIDPNGNWPIVWQRAKGVHVWDAEGKKYLDLTAAFGVAVSGHANARVVRAGQKQMRILLHAMGDVHPHPLKAQLARELSRITFERWTEQQLEAAGRNRKVHHAKTIFCNSGFEAIEAALKTALMATGKRGVIAFRGAYHGVGYGALNTTHRDHFRSPFRAQLREFAEFLPFPDQAAGDLQRLETQLVGAIRRKQIGAVLVEPIQVRGGINVPPSEFLPLLRRVCDEHKVVLILDEIYTGFGRTGAWFACEHSGVIPDVICLGKALTGGFPLSACVGRADLMDDAWPPSQGEAIHTTTFLGHPVGCAMALAQIKEIETRSLVQRSAKLGNYLLSALAEIPSRASELRFVARGCGLLVGLEIRRQREPATGQTIEALKTLLRGGLILLPEGEHANVISFTPPLTITKRQISEAVGTVKKVLRMTAG